MPGANGSAKDGMSLKAYTSLNERKEVQQETQKEGKRRREKRMGKKEMRLRRT